MWVSKSSHKARRRDLYAVSGHYSDERAHALFKQMIRWDLLFCMESDKHRSQRPAGSPKVQLLSALYQIIGRKS